MTIPRLKFEGADSAKQMNRVFAENLQDMLRKVDDGRGSFPAGFFHTSTVPHEGTCYYGEVWCRDGGRGLIELARFGFAREAMQVARFFLSHINHEDHWGRTVHPEDPSLYEIDGNALILLGIYQTWFINGQRRDLGAEFIDALMPTFRWIERLMRECPYGHLLPCESELSGNPNTPYQVYAIFPNYGVLAALSALKVLAHRCGCEKEAAYLDGLAAKMADSLLDRLVSKGRPALTPQGCWLNGLDGRDGRPYEFSEWDGTSWPVFHWTRQLPFILGADTGLLGLAADAHRPVHTESYQYVQRQMCRGEYFRKYGFVSNTCWTGMGDRHDDTMCGYGQGFMTQAALLMDDINTYTKLLEGVTRLAYDGDVVEPLTHEMNPWVMHECFNYEYYEHGRDHTFGVMAEGRPGIMDNPGDEGNLVQEAEIIKALAMVAGIENTPAGGLRIMPRLPWTWDEMLLEDFPVLDARGNMGRINVRLAHERWRRRSALAIESTLPLENVAVRIGPFPSEVVVPEEGLAVEKSKGGSWIWLEGLSGERIEREIRLG